MLPRIRQLPPLVINQIAAGEVIERPASVVKELLENSVDAGSSRIEIDVEQGGQDLIRIVDNGCGIAAADLPLVFANHATSKLRDAEDLFSIGSFGFRGEALASIGGVAEVLLQSRPATSDVGAMIGCAGSELSNITPWGGAPGTRIEVRKLFFNTPVRRKFLRTPATEMGHISESVTRLALAYPRKGEQLGLHLILRHNARMVHEIPATTTLVDRLGLFFGEDLPSKLYEVDVESGTIHLSGWVADPSCDRGNARMQYLFVNGRWIRDRGLCHGLQEAYRGLLMTGRYAVAFLFLEMPASEIDVNVHPTKSEVRFRQASMLHQLILNGVKQRLRKANLTARLIPTSTIAPPIEPQAILPFRQALEPRESLGSEVVPEVQSTSESQQPSQEIDLTESIASPSRLPLDAPLQPQITRVTFPPAAPALSRREVEPEPPADAREMAWEDPRVLQLYDSYLVVETEQGMLVIDQHALHERILYERFRERIERGTLQTQALLIPDAIDLSTDAAARVLEQRDALADLGLGIEDFGSGTVLLTRYPALLGRRSPRAALLSVVDHLMSHEKTPSRQVLFNDLLSLMACHAAVRAGERLAPELIRELVAMRRLADDHHHCPHGRPTALLFTRHDLERQFRRA